MTLLYKGLIIPTILASIGTAMTLVLFLAFCYISGKTFAEALGFPLTFNVIALMYLASLATTLFRKD